MSNDSLLQVEDLRTLFRQGGGISGRGVEVKAVDCVSFTMTRGEVLGLVGESGWERLRPGAPFCGSSSPPRGASGSTAKTS